MDHVVYVVVSDRNEVGAIAKAASEIAPSEFDFAVMPRPDVSEPKPETELAFRIAGADSPEEALSRAWVVYARSREAAGLGPDEDARLSVGAWPGG